MTSGGRTSTSTGTGLLEGLLGAFAPALREAGYDVSYRPFEGGHTVPPPIADEGVAWWLEPKPAGESPQ